MRHNREAFERWRIVPRMLHGVTQRELVTSVLGTQLPSPVLLAPIGAASIVASNSDVTIARGAAAAGTPYVISSQGSNPMEDTDAVAGQRHPVRHRCAYRLGARRKRMLDRSALHLRASH